MTPAYWLTGPAVRAPNYLWIFPHPPQTVALAGHIKEVKFFSLQQLYTSAKPHSSEINFLSNISVPQLSPLYETGKDSLLLGQTITLCGFHTIQVVLPFCACTGHTEVFKKDGKSGFSSQDFATRSTPALIFPAGPLGSKEERETGNHTWGPSLRPARTQSPESLAFGHQEG